MKKSNDSEIVLLIVCGGVIIMTALFVFCWLGWL